MKNKVKTPKCESCNKVDFNLQILYFNEIKDSNFIEITTEKRFCSLCQKMFMENNESIGHFKDNESQKIYSSKDLLYFMEIEKHITNELSQEAKDFIRSYHKNSIAKILFQKEQVVKFIAWIKYIEGAVCLKPIIAKGKHSSP